MRRSLLAVGLPLALAIFASSAQATVTSNIANAPGWAQSTSYAAGQRVVSGPGYAAGGTYTSGSALYLWAVVTAGTSSGTGNGPTIAGSCAASTAITDGTVTWKCLTPVDYVAISDFLFDDAAWAASTGYDYHDYMVSGGTIYRAEQGTTVYTTCTSGTSAPSGNWGTTNGNVSLSGAITSGATSLTTSAVIGGSATTEALLIDQNNSSAEAVIVTAGAGTTGLTVTRGALGTSAVSHSNGTTVLAIIGDGGTCFWQYFKQLLYSSQASHIPKQRYLSTPGGQPTIQMTDYYVGKVWSGGASRTEYVPGSNGETAPIISMAHADYTTDDSTSEIQPKCNNGTGWPGCGGAGVTSYYTITLQAAAGDSFRDSSNAKTNALAYNASNGVAIHASATFVQCSLPVGAVIVTSACNSDAIGVVDSGTAFIGLQAKADHGTSFDARSHGNGMTVRDSIADAAQSVKDSVIRHTDNIKAKHS